MSEVVINPLQSDNPLQSELESLKQESPKKLNRLTKKNKSTLSVDDDSLFDPLYLDELKKNAFDKLKKAEKNLKKSEQKYMEALDEFNKLFDKKGGRRHSKSKKNRPFKG